MHADRRLVLITGTGRSGTSTMAGLFHHLGVEVPGPYLGANESNPKGFFESRWSMRFHDELCKRAQMHVMDSRPTAFDSLQDVVTPQDRAKLERWIGKVSAGHDQVVVKDPRNVWTQHLWREAAAGHGLETVYVSMLRHPAETIGSRATYYASSDVEKRRRYEIFNISRWINNQLVSERGTRGMPRSFIGYTNLLTDWRAEAVRLADELNINWPGEIAEGVHSPVDDFITPDLRRVQVTWNDLEIPAELQAIADGIWNAVLQLRAGGGADDDASAAMDELRVRYDELFYRSSAISHDAALGLAAEKVSEAELAAKTAAKAARKPAPTGENRAVRNVSSRELLRTVAGRAKRRLLRAK